MALAGGQMTGQHEISLGQLAAANQSVWQASGNVESIPAGAATCFALHKTETHSLPHCAFAGILRALRLCARPLCGEMECLESGCWAAALLHGAPAIQPAAGCISFAGPCPLLPTRGLPVHKPNHPPTLLRCSVASMALCAACRCVSLLAMSPPPLLQDLPPLPTRSVASMALSVLPVSVISQRNKAYMAQLQHTVQVLLLLCACRCV